MSSRRIFLHLQGVIYLVTLVEGLQLKFSAVSSFTPRNGLQEQEDGSSYPAYVYNDGSLREYFQTPKSSILACEDHESRPGYFVRTATEGSRQFAFVPPETLAEADIDGNQCEEETSGYVGSPTPKSGSFSLNDSLMRSSTKQTTASLNTQWYGHKPQVIRSGSKTRSGSKRTTSKRTTSKQHSQLWINILQDPFYVDVLDKKERACISQLTHAQQIVERVHTVTVHTITQKLAELDRKCEEEIQGEKERFRLTPRQQLEHLANLARQKYTHRKNGEIATFLQNLTKTEAIFHHMRDAIRRGYLASVDAVQREDSRRHTSLETGLRQAVGDGASSGYRRRDGARVPKNSTPVGIQVIAETSQTHEDMGATSNLVKQRLYEMQSAAIKYLEDNMIGELQKIRREVGQQRTGMNAAELMVRPKTPGDAG